VRGFTADEQIQELLSSPLSSLKNPLLMLGMKHAVTRMIQALHNHESVCIYADFDLDGSSGLALLYEGLQSLGFAHLMYYQPKRLSEGYGFHAAAVEDLKSRGVSLIITVDVGITATAACARAKALGVDVIITDHHQPNEQLPDAFTVVNPNQKGDTSGLGYLCGAGVAFYFLRALKRAMADEAYVSGYEAGALDLKALTDFLTIATLTDMVPLVADNRALVKVGLKQIENTQRPGLRALLKNLELWGRSLTSQEVAIRMAPKLNALSRMEVDILPVDIFLEKDPEKAEHMVQTMLGHNEDRVQLQQQGEKEAVALIGPSTNQGFVFVISKNFHRGVVGLIATKLCSVYGVPAFVGSCNSEGLVVGSARVPQGSGQSVLLAMQSLGEVLNRSGGHHQASGFELYADREDLARKGFANYFSQAQAVIMANTEFDLDMSSHDLDTELMNWLEAVGPFGQSFPYPVFAFRSQIIRSVKVLKGGHWKITAHSLTEGHGEGPRDIEALFFSPSPHRKIPATGEIFDLFGEPQWNHFAGRKRIQVLIKDLVPAVV
jgi:single-stranded-DNA-specific exonuclease